MKKPILPSKKNFFTLILLLISFLGFSTSPTISSLGSTNGCVGTSITINGTNLTAATAVKIGGTAVSSITSNTSTKIVAVIGAGTTGTVSVTTAGGTATSAATFTVNPLPAQPSAITGNTTICSGSSQNYSVTNVVGITYTWAFPAGWTQTAGGTTNSVTVTTNGTSGNITVTPSNPCIGTARTLAVTSSTVPNQPSTITGNTTPCVGTSQTYSITNVAGTTYNWIFPADWTQTAGGTTNSITVTIGSLSGNVQATPSNSCGSGTARSLAVTSTVTASQPSSITGSTTPCQGSSINYSVTNVSGITYTWAFPAGWSQTAGGTTNSITVTVGATSGNITVTPSNSCGSSTAQTLAVITSPLPSQPSGVTGNLTICSGSSQNYSVTNVAGITYTWAFPAGWSQTAGGTTNSVTVTTSGTSGTITVTPSNSCGSGTAQTLVTTITSPTATAGSALTSICTGGTSAALGGSFGGTASGATWSSSAGGTFANNTGTTPGTATWTAPAAYSGTAILTLTTSGGSCGTTTATKNQTVTAGSSPSTATVGASQKNYATKISTSLGGNTPTVGTGAWSLVSGPGTVAFSASTSGSSTATVSAYGIYVFRWTITNGTCGSSTADINVTYLPFKDPEYTILYENFDNSNGGWVSSGTIGSWGYTNTASSVHCGEGNFWAVNTTSSKYPNSALTYLTSPTVNTTGFKNVKFFLDVRYDTSSDTQDGMQIQYSTDNGTTWLVLGDNSAPTTWYISNGVNALSASLSNTNGWNNNNSTAVAPVSQFEERSIQTSVLDNNATLKFRAVFASNSSTNDIGVAIDNVIVKGDPIVALSNPVKGPGSINGNLKLWLKSNTGTSTTADGTALASWSDQAFDNNSVGISGNSPIYRNNATRNINYNPVVDFAAASSQVMKGKGGYWSQDYYVVIKTNGTIDNSVAARQVPISGRTATTAFNVDGTALGLGNFTARYANEMVSHNISSIPITPPTDIPSYGRAYTSTTDNYNQETIIFNVKTNSSGTATEIYKNGKRIDNTDGQTVASDQVTFTGTMNFSEFNNLQYNLGVGRFTLGGNAPSYLDGRMTEVVSYSSPKTALEQQKIQSYLGIKNGITLHAMGSITSDDLCDVNYIDSSANIIWNTTANSGYNYDIAGIGRDDNTQLNQKQSKTENPTPDISIGLGNLLDVNSNNPNTFTGDKNFLVWGNNHGSLSAQPSVAVNMSAGVTPALATNVDFISIGRTWKVVETGGNVPTSKVSIPTTMLSATLTPPGDYLMFISNTPAFDPTAEYRVMTVNGSNLETTYDFDGTKYITFGFAPEHTFSRSIAFDGANDYLDAGQVLDLNTSFTVSAWIKRNSNNQTILSKRDNAFTTGYDLSINSAGKVEMSWINGTKQTITSNVTIPIGIWHNVSAIYDGTTAKLYIDGVMDISKAMPIVPANSQSFLIAAADAVNTTSFFNGNIDEVRVWNVALTEKQLRYVMNQEILSNGTATNGSIIPNTITLNDISIIPWSNLSAYYPMSTYTYTNAKDLSNNHYTAALRNLTTVDYQTAPLPYQSAADGAWQTPATWLNNNVQDLPNSASLVSGTVDWNIVQTSNAISSTGNKTVLALMVNSNTINASNDSKIEISNYLKLNGKIDLVGKSQLVQSLNSDLDVTSAGSIERDQQGQSNKYNYNYWSSPVNPINNTTNNTNYTVGGVMKDGTTTTPTNINWIAGYDGAPTTPISLARYWLYKFDNYANLYANWVKITETSSVRVGQGFTLKGSGAASGTQNLTFVGKPNNGLITTNTVAANQLLLTGNPYSSALDADAFITDNAGSIDGSLYFWEQYTTNNTHVLADYQGGYATRNLGGGVPPISSGVDFINQTGTSTRLAPNQYIPVGQGFFVNGGLTGGIVKFNNNQRAFHKEDEVGVSTIMYKKRPVKANHWNDNSNDLIVKDTLMRIRLGFNSNNNYHRQVLLGFMNENATSDMDYGYDSLNFDDSPNDMYLLNGDNQLVIEGEGYFDVNSSYPIGVKTDVEGKVSFVIDALENFSPEQTVYIYDNVTNTYNDIRNGLYEVNMPIGENDTRFALRFTNKSQTTKTLSVNDNIINNDIKITHIQNANLLVINNNLLNVTVEKVELFNILGQSIASWKTENLDQQNIQIPIKSISSGIYIAKVKTTNGELSKKIIIK
ncbi:LamG-like jellyroll fold domain-containing protein [Flavobacterium sp.]|uniref:LamG-like jellyroll fold domain-containing protein n=1 Tax=Flavobacterium sp. TaxID=239 RepID=UPI0037953494